jgi:ubiquitin-protein ligase E3 B
MNLDFEFLLQTVFFFRYIISSLEQESPKMSCIGVSLNKDLAVAWIHHIKKIMEIALCYLEHLNPESPHDAKTMTVYLHLLVIF